ncbi:hypothetical protein [Streptomyces adustus]|uniref:hypothetical protein n=1 Tax=Streptomyces adustus TaxID=1609272 RepID=UPI003720169D
MDLVMGSFRGARSSVQRQAEHNFDHGNAALQETSVWERFFVTVVVATMAEPLLRRMRQRWRRMRIRRTVAALSQGDTTHVRCATRFRNSGGRRRRARLTVEAAGVFLSSADGTVAKLQLGTPLATVEVVAERSMLVCDVAGRQLEILLPAEEDRLFEAVAARIVSRSSEHLAADAVPGSLLESAPPRHKS